jgi:hypothetical protein
MLAAVSNIVQPLLGTLSTGIFDSTQAQAEATDYRSQICSKRDARNGANPGSMGVELRTKLINKLITIRGNFIDLLTI